MQTQNFFRNNDDEQPKRPSIYTTDMLYTGNRVARRDNDQCTGTVKHIFGRTIIVLFDGQDATDMVDDHLLIILADKPNDPSMYTRPLI